MNQNSEYEFILMCVSCVYIFLNTECIFIYPFPSYSKGGRDICCCWGGNARQHTLSFHGLWARSLSTAIMELMLWIRQNKLEFTTPLLCSIPRFFHTWLHEKHKRAVNPDFGTVSITNGKRILICWCSIKVNQVIWRWAVWVTWQ